MAGAPADAAKLRARLAERKRLISQQNHQQQQVPQTPTVLRTHLASSPAQAHDATTQRKQRRSEGEGEVVQTGRRLIVEHVANELAEPQHPARARSAQRQQPTRSPGAVVLEGPAPTESTFAPAPRAGPPPPVPEAAKPIQRVPKATRRVGSPPPVPTTSEQMQRATQQPRSPNALWHQSASFKAHSLRVMHAIDQAFGLLRNLDELVPLLERLGKRHVGYGAKPEHYDWVGSALVSTLHTAFGPEIMNDGMTHAYVTVYSVVKHAMLSGAGEGNLGQMPKLPTSEQADAVVKTWAAAKEQVGLQDVGQQFFKTLFAQHPESMGLFARFQHAEGTPPGTSDEEDDFEPPPLGQASHPASAALATLKHQARDGVPECVVVDNAVSETGVEMGHDSPRVMLEGENGDDSSQTPNNGSSQLVCSTPASMPSPRDSTPESEAPEPEPEPEPEPKPKQELVPMQLRSGADVHDADDEATQYRRRRKRLASFAQDGQRQRHDSDSSAGSSAMTESTQQLLLKTTRITTNKASEQKMAQEIKRLAELEAKQRRWSWLTSLRLMPTLSVVIGLIFLLLQPELVCWALYSGTSSFWTPDMSLEEVCHGSTGLAVLLGFNGKVMPDDAEPVVPTAFEPIESPTLSEDDISLLLEAVHNGNDATKLVVAASLQSGGVSNMTALALFELSGSRAVLGGNYMVQQFDVNDAIANYLAVVGLIYALIFSQQYASAISRQREIEESLATEAGGIQICMNLVRVLDDHSHYNSAKVKVLLLLSSYVEDLASHIAVMAGREHVKYDAYLPLESLYSVVPILAEICQNQMVDRLLLERNLDLINQVVQARQSRLTSEKRRISKWVWALLFILAMSTLWGVIMIQGGSAVLNRTFCVVTVMVITGGFMVLADMEQPFGGFVQIDVASFHEIRKDIRIVLRSAHLTQLQQVEDHGQDLTSSQSEMLHEHKQMSARGKSVAKLDTSTALANAERRLTAGPQHIAAPARRRSITELFVRTPRSDGVRDEEEGDGGKAFVAQFATMVADDGTAPGTLPSEGNSLLSDAVLQRMQQRRRASIDGSAQVTAGRKRNSIDLSSFGKGLVVEHFATN